MFLTFHLNKKWYLIFISLIITIIIICLGIVSFAKTKNVKQGVKLPIIMYHSMLKNKTHQGKYVISPYTFENDVIYLNNNGYTTVVMEDLIDYVYKEKSLPEKPIMLTFDDGFYNNYLYAYNIAKKYNIKIIISPIGICTDMFSQNHEEDHPIYSYCTWDEINEMIMSGFVEFQNHSYNLHNCGKGKRFGIGKMNNESSEKYRSMLYEDLSKMQQKMKEHTGYTPTTFVYPFGKISHDSIPVIKKLGFKASLNCESRTNYITMDTNCLYGLGRYLRPNKTTSEAYFTKIGIN